MIKAKSSGSKTMIWLEVPVPDPLLVGSEGSRTIMSWKFRFKNYDISWKFRFQNHDKAGSPGSKIMIKLEVQIPEP